jgi:hypothetical protein
MSGGYTHLFFILSIASRGMQARWPRGQQQKLVRAAHEHGCAAGSPGRGKRLNSAICFREGLICDPMLLGHTEWLPVIVRSQLPAQAWEEEAMSVARSQHV